MHVGAIVPIMNQPTCMSKEDERESTTAGHFPPNSRVTGVKCFTAADITILPTRALPAIGFLFTKSSSMLMMRVAYIKQDMKEKEEEEEKSDHV